MRFPLKYGDINVTTSERNSIATYGYVANFVGSYVDFVVTKDDIHSLNAWNIFLPNMRPAKRLK